ncbi:MAG: hypothetical protein GAK28_00751 [Luteibacter sp.]|uniref:general secretion pathway protein GspJ n=1 Tax=Luteibacter sp. TaxID=1886636 RepID=UPI001383B266|nr:general secretion pathway protein GspJ [Luteibacter sp.]KAF1009118.1 MAG: hypothetical protein GAK28_00751 [Luteibacter sp.]
MKRAAGFSLMETLGALALLALLLLGVTASLQTMARSTRAGMASTERLDQVRAAQMYMRRALSEAMAYPWALQERRPVVLKGAADEVSFVASGPGYLARSGLQLQRLAIVGEEGDKRVEVAFAPLAARNAAQIVPSEPEVLIDHVVSGHFVYSGLDNEGNPVAWQSTWPFPNRLPTMVGVELVIAGGVHWPTLTVPLRMDPAATNAREALARLQTAKGA